ncbi:MAG: hypothetical protein IT438_08275 [Phycisphaerales bacterium]|nr:hypothetical protein [Phycisphaerales bacterium]
MRSPGASPIVRAILTNSTLVELSGDQATISCSDRFARGARERLAEIATLFRRELGRQIEVRIAEQSPAASTPDGDGPSNQQSVPAPAESPVDDPLVKLAAELFGAKIVAVTHRPGPRG